MEMYPKLTSGRKREEESRGCFRPVKRRWRGESHQSSPLTDSETKARQAAPTVSNRPDLLSSSF
jgi:hypothetical protein